MIKRSYHELILLPTFEERYEYLKLTGVVGDQTFGGHRQLNQLLYQSCRWKGIRDDVIIRDNGRDLGVRGYPIRGSVYIHHINPVTIEDILEERPCVFDLDNLISTSFKTHNAIHYGRAGESVYFRPAERRPNDTCPWK